VCILVGSSLYELHLLMNRSAEDSIQNVHKTL
jgi:hypothetical protein